jgi:hypothetical protein
VHKRQPVQIPKLSAHVALRTVRGIIWARVTMQWAPKVQLNLTVIERLQPRRHFVVGTNTHGLASYAFRLPRPPLHHYRTVTVRVWGVYAHHRRLVVVQFRLNG